MLLQQENVDCRIYTFKDGLLSRVAHDLEIRVTQLSMKLDAETKSIEATFDANSLRVQTAMQDGKPHQALSQSDFAKIEANIKNDVLRSAKYPQASFRSTLFEVDDSTAKIEGKLNLCGITQTIRTVANKSGNLWIAELRIHQPDFGITPYSAMLGTLKVKPEVLVKIAVPA